jgi:hypothetical protein
MESLMKQALIVWGGWMGHTPKECMELFAPWLRKSGYELTVSTTLDSYLDKDKMLALSLIVPIWTMGKITREQSAALREAVASGVGIAGWHGGMCDSFREDTDYQWMTGGQWVAHPGGCIPSYRVKVIRPDHPITRGLKDFTMVNTEQYYMHVDPSNEVLATTTFESGCVMPQVWTRMWGKGKVFYCALGHTFKDFEIPEALAIVQRGMLWASR